MRWVLALAAMAAAILVFLSPGRAVVTEPVVSVDTDTTGNDADTVGTIDPCLEVTVGPEFDIDVTIEQVTDLAGFELQLGYDPAVLEVIGVDCTNCFLSTAGSVTDFGEAPTPGNPDTDGMLSMVCALFPLPSAGATGEGVLARVKLRAVASGLSDLNLSGIKLPDINNDPIGDEDNDDYFDGPVANGQIAVDQPCSTPSPTPTPTPAPDSDGDGMPDEYENAHGCLDPLVADSMGNPDGDLLLSYGEMIVGSDPCTANPELDLDSDGDGFKDGVEAYIGTDSADSCTNAPGTHDAWPPDNNVDTWCNVMDVLNFKPHLVSQFLDPKYDRRFDLNADQSINILDVLMLKPHISTSCTNP